MSIKNKNIKKECLRIEEDAIHSSKGHYNSSSFWEKIHYGIGISTIIFSAGAGLDVFINNAIYTGYLAIPLTLLTTLQTFINPNEKAVKHKNSGDEFNNLKNQTRLLRELETNISTEKDMVEKVKLLSNKYSELNRISLQILTFAFKKAKKGIDEGQAQYLADKEYFKLFT